MASANFGALTDHFSAISTGLVLIGSSKTPVAKSVAEALDENGDVAEHTIYGADDIFDVSCEYEIHAASFDSGTLKLGEIVAGTAVSSITITTSNGAWPKVSISGRIGLETMLAPDGKANTYTLPSLTIIGAKAAQPLGFSVDGGSLSGSSIEASAEIAESPDGLGVPAVHGISGASGTLNASFVRTPDETPAWTLTLTGATSVQEPGSEQPQAAYHTASAQAKFIIARDASA
jgi:hypothetical protein